MIAVGQQSGDLNFELPAVWRSKFRLVSAVWRSKFGLASCFRVGWIATGSRYGMSFQTQTESLGAI